MKSIFLIALFVTATTHATEAPAPEVRLGFWDAFTAVPGTAKDTLRTSFSRDAVPGWGAIFLSTALLYHYDEQLYSYSQKKGRDWGIGNEDNTKPLVSAFGQELVRLPSDTGSALYFLGDGWMHFSIAASFYGAGRLRENTYNANTGVILLHGMVVSTLFNQTLKRSFGRESPEVKTHARGAWRPFPSFSKYNSNTASYDAMPSGHVMTATLTFTVLAERYPRYNVPIYAVGGVWISALMFQMMNNGVHWASDYPLGIGMGWVIGKAATRMVERVQPSADKTTTSAWKIWPMLGSRSGLIAMKEF